MLILNTALCPKNHIDVFQLFQNYPEDEILIGYDGDFKHGQNFIICTTVEAKEELLKKPEKVMFDKG